MNYRTLARDKSSHRLAEHQSKAFLFSFTPPFFAGSLFAGRAIGRCMQQHRHREFIRFLAAIEAAVPAGKLIHAIADNYATHKHPKVSAWLARHPRWTFHFTPTSASWLNAVEGSLPP